MTVTVTGDLEKFVQGKIDAGEYRSPLEVVAEALMRLKEADHQEVVGDAPLDREAPRLIDKQGVLVVEAEVVGDLGNVVADQREQRMRTFAGRGGQ